MRLLDFNSFINESYISEDQSLGQVTLSSTGGEVPPGKTDIACKGGLSNIAYGISSSDAMFLLLPKEGQPVSLHKKGEQVDDVYDHKYTTPEQVAANAYSILMSFLQSIGKSIDYGYIGDLLSGLNSAFVSNKKECGSMFTAFVVGLKNNRTSPTEAAKDFTSLNVNPRPDYNAISQAAIKAFA